jgi:hypothetical protein
MKVFKILNPKKGGGQGTSADSDSARGAPQGVPGNKNVRALIDETNKRIDELTSDEVHKKIGLMKTALENVKRGIRHPSARLKPSNIITPTNFEQAEIKRYSQEIREIEIKLRVIKKREEEEEQRMKDN